MLSNRSRRSRRSRGVVESLEERRLFIVFTATAGEDTIIVTSGVSGPGQFTSVQINGGPVQSTSAGIVYIDALGGNDSVYFPRLERNSNTTAPSIEIALGDGDDYASNYNPATGLASTADIDFGLQVSGGEGIDTLSIDATNGQGMSEQTFKPGRLQFRSSVAFSISSFGYGTTMEKMSVLGSGAAEGFVMEAKPAELLVTVGGGGGDDLFFVGRRVAGTLPSDPPIDIPFSQNGWVAGTTTLTGGAGDGDEVRFYDVGAAPGTYATDNFNLSKAGHGFLYSAFETQRFEPALGSTVRLNSLNGAIVMTRVWGESCTVNIGNGNLGNLPGTFQLSLYGASSAVNINDFNDTGNDVYDLTTFLSSGLVPTLTGKFEKNPFVASQVVTWFGAATVTLNGGTGGTSTSLRGSLTGTTTRINGGPGHDTIRINPGDIDAAILGPVFVNGGGGIDEVSFDDRLDTTSGVVTLDGGTFTDGFAHTTSGVERLIVESGGGPGAVVNVPRVTLPTTIAAPSGTAINIGAGNLDANVLNDLSIASGGVVTLDDRLDTGDDGYRINGLQFQKYSPGARVIEMGQVVAAVLQANDGDNLIEVQQGTNALSIRANGGNDRIEIDDTGNFFGLQTIGVDTGSERTKGGDRIDIDTDAGTPSDYGASVRLQNDDVVNDVTIRAGGRVQVPTGVVLRANSLSNVGVIDLAGGALLLSAAASGSVRPWITTGRNGGTWDGSGASGAIRSSLAAGSAVADAVGYGYGSSVGTATVGSFNIGPTEMLVRHTLSGDANLDLTVGFGDLVSLAQNYNASGRVWTQGEFNYDPFAAVGFDDLVSLAQNYNQGLSAATWTLALQTAAEKRKPDTRGAGKLTI